MLDETARKAVALEYCRRINAKDIEGVVSLFAEDLYVEDPVGSRVFTGRAAYRAHVSELVTSDVHEEPGIPVAALDGEHVALPIAVTARPPRLSQNKVAKMNVIALIRMGGDDLIHQMRVFCGHTDTTLGDAHAATPPKPAT